MKTYSLKASEIKRDWHFIDASHEKLGRLANRIAVLLMGKHKPTYTPNLDGGDFVVVINADKIQVTKAQHAEEKVYYHHTGYPSGIRSVTLDRLLETHPTRAVEFAVKGMLPRTRLGARMRKRLKVYAGDSHPHEAQLEKVENQKEA